MGTWAVSPRFTNNDLANATFERKVEVYGDQVTGWLFDHAGALAVDTYPQRQHAGMAILTLVSAYFEGLACFLEGGSSDGRSKEFFRYGFLDVFPDLQTNVATLGVRDLAEAMRIVLDAIYRELRCGLYHEAALRVALSDRGAPIELELAPGTAEVGTILVNPFAFLGAVRAHFNRYLARLGDPAERDLRAAFEREFDRRMGT
jgi:hypothetical protein